MFGRTHGTKHPPDRGHLLGLLSGEDFHQRLALFGIGTLINHKLHNAVAFMHSTRPVPHCRGTQSVKANVAKMSLIDLIARDSLAKAFVGQGVELTRASVDTVAVDKLGAFDFPFD